MATNNTEPKYVKIDKKTKKIVTKFAEERNSSWTSALKTIIKHRDKKMNPQR